MHTHILSDIRKMLFYRSLNVYLDQCGTKRFSKFTGIVIRSVRCAKAWHGHSQNIFSFQSQHIKCADCHKQGKCGIQTT